MPERNSHSLTLKHKPLKNDPRLLPASHEDLGHEYEYKCDYYTKIKVNNLSHQTLISQTVNVSSLLSGSV